MPELDEGGLKLFFKFLITRDFPRLPGSLASRLASTMVERRRRVLYRRARLLGPGWEQRGPIKLEADLNKSAQMPSSQVNATAALTISGKRKRQPEDLLAIPSPSSFSSKAGTDPSPSLYHPYGGLAVSEAQSVALDHTAELLLPPPPSACQNDPSFVCDLCCMILDSQVGKDDALWKMHIQEDLDPYVCLFDGCPLPHDIYSTSKEWLHHAREEHLVIWRCLATDHNVLDFGTREELAKHMEDAHPGIFDEELLQSMVNAGRTSSAVVFESCPFCGQSPSAIEEHVGHHLRYLALKSLPWSKEIDEAGAKEDKSDYVVLGDHDVTGETSSQDFSAEGSIATGYEIIKNIDDLEEVVSIGQERS
ncbi:hypothetical protein F5Y10DRAFT_261375 [Nemania abortiva]|nr:hypothetical protein F5Y10DRAFT_261375 [Nemania abortiva]